MPESSQDRPTYKFGDFHVDLFTGDIRKNGRKVRLQEKPFQILRMLLARPGEVVTREELRQRLWPADTYVDFDANLNTSLNRLRNALGDKASEQTLIKTIPRQGYRFIASVTEVQIAKEEAKEVATSREEDAAPQSARAAVAPGMTLRVRRRGIWIGLLSLAVVIVGIAYFGWRHHSANTSDLKGHVTILVIPLADMDREQDHDLLGDSLTEETITRLGRVAPQQISVIARSTAMQYRDGRRTVAQMASEQHADYVFEGGYRRQGYQLRITAQLFDGKNQSSVWSDVYERDTGDLFTVEREVSEQIANSIWQHLLVHSKAQLAVPTR